MVEKKKTIQSKQWIPLVRKNRVTFVFNDDEMKLVERFITKYKIQNKSRWMRETIIHSVLQKMEEDYPTLFEECEMKKK